MLIGIEKRKEGDSRERRLVGEEHRSKAANQERRRTEAKAKQKQGTLPFLLVLNLLIVDTALLKRSRRRRSPSRFWRGSAERAPPCFPPRSNSDTQVNESGQRGMQGAESAYEVVAGAKSGGAQAESAQAKNQALRYDDVISSSSAA